MPSKRFFHRIADNQQADGALERTAQATLGALAPIYGAGAWAKRLLHDLGLRETHRLPAAVFSVGNISMGGTGKTPVSVWVARWLAGKGKRPAVLSRGYGRADEDALVVVHDGTKRLAKTREAGDEPVLLGQLLGDVPVIACADRARGGRHALKRFKADALVLDDGFQHVRLERQADIVLVDSTRPLFSLRLFPRGSLREPLGSLSRAHLLVLTRCENEKRADRLAKALHKRFPHVPVVRTRFDVTGLRVLATGERLEPAALKGERVILACGVGNPDSVKLTVRQLGARIVGSRILEDHAEWTKREELACDSARQKAGARWLVVTEKDAVKIRELGRPADTILVLETELAFLAKRDRVVMERALDARLQAGRVRGYLN
jgi:tetraacyldisaccharide 4'-kinase